MSPAEIELIVREIESIDQQTRALFDRRESLEQQVCDELTAHHEGHIVLSDGRPVRARNNFIDPDTGLPRNVAFHAARVKFWELVIGKRKVRKRGE